MAKVLVVGGAGYVGSTTCAYLLDHGHEVVVLDDLSTGYRKLVLASQFVQAKAGDRSAVLSLLQKGRFDCVMHFAARSLVGESVLKPDEYFENNVVQTQALLDAMLESGVKRFIFSSTCAVFGDPGDRDLDESLPKNPLSPYGHTKLQVEEMLEKYAKEKGLQSIALRYFNASGADPALRAGECHEPETHLIPRILKSIRSGRALHIFGDDFATPDGTCIRDYIHVSDLAQAHESAMQRLVNHSSQSGSFQAYNLGSENGTSVRQIISACEKVLNLKLKTETHARRPGDPPRLVANSKLAQKELGFHARRGTEEIIQSAWDWELKHAATLKPAVFLDRDGTLNEDPGYLNHPDQLKLYPQVGEALGKLKRAGYQLVVVSNQSGVARGLVKESDLPAIHQRLDELIAESSASIDLYELCTHHPEDQCECRKPKPKLLEVAARKLGLDLARSFMVGDKVSDVRVGAAAHCRASVLVRTGEGKTAEKELKKSEVAFIADSLLEAADWILRQGNAIP